MDLEDYRFYRDEYLFEALNTAKGDEIVGDSEPMVTYELEEGDLRIYDNRGVFSRIRFWEPDYVIGMEIEIGDNTREMYLSADLEAWNEFDLSVMNELEDNQAVKRIR